MVSRVISEIFTSVHVWSFLPRDLQRDDQGLDRKWRLEARDTIGRAQQRRDLRHGSDDDFGDLDRTGTGTFLCSRLEQMILKTEWVLSSLLFKKNLLHFEPVFRNNDSMKLWHAVLIFEETTLV